MFVFCYASSSRGNLYRVVSDSFRTQLLIECGLPMKDIRKCLGTQMNKIDGVLISHEHKDHSKAARDFLKVGIDIYTSKGTLTAIGAEKSAYSHCIKSQEVITIGDITVLPFEINHDAAEPLGFMLRDNNDIVMFATDTYNVEYKINKVTKLMIECNHSYEIIDKKVAAGTLDKKRAERLVRSHFSLENLKKWLKMNDLTSLKEIFLLHLSKTNADPIQFRKEIEELTGVPTYIADENILKTGNYYSTSGTWELIPKVSDTGRFFDKSFREVFELEDV